MIEHNYFILLWDYAWFKFLIVMLVFEISSLLCDKILKTMLIYYSLLANLKNVQYNI